MSGMAKCTCHPMNAVVTHVGHNHSRFHGGFQLSAYSEVKCLTCGTYWRTKAKYLDSLPRPQDGYCCYNDKES